MFLKKCCFFLPLNVGCMIIGGILTGFHVGELITHNGDSVFIRMTSTKWWAPVILCPILVFGTLSSILLIYAASKRKRGYVLLWLITYVFILDLDYHPYSRSYILSADSVWLLQISQQCGI
nr:uncharacterized protein LOC108009309 isoform X2 [Drosophila suzukii]